MSSVGTYLRELRQRRGASLEEIARTTRVARHYLESLEADAFDALPSPVFTRGFIRAYCQALSEPPTEALAAYEGREGRTPQQIAAAARLGAPAARAGAPAARGGEPEPRGRGAVLVSFVLLVVLGVALFAVALLIHPRDRAERVATEPADTRPARSADETPPIATPVTPPPRPSAPAGGGASTTPGSAATGTTAPMTAAPSAAASGGAAGAAPPVAAVTTPPVAAVTTPPATMPALDALVSVSSPYRLVARTNETTWIRVRTEDGRMSEENVPPGEVREWISNRPFTLTIGNAGGVSFELNGRSVPQLGPKGAVIQRIVLPPEAR